MIDSEQQQIKSGQNTQRKLNMNSIMHNSSQFDMSRQNASTIDGTQISVMNYTNDGFGDNAVSQEQQHNCMNLALGKPTQSFRQRDLPKLKMAKKHMRSN